MTNLEPMIWNPTTHTPPRMELAHTALPKLSLGQRSLASSMSLLRTRTPFWMPSPPRESSPSPSTPLTTGNFTPAASSMSLSSATLTNSTMASPSLDTELRTKTTGLSETPGVPAGEKKVTFASFAERTCVESPLNLLTPRWRPPTKKGWKCKFSTDSLTSNTQPVEIEFQPYLSSFLLGGFEYNLLQKRNIALDLIYCFFSELNNVG